VDIVGGLLAAWQQQQQRHFDATRLVKQNEPVELAPNARASVHQCSERCWFHTTKAVRYLSIYREAGVAKPGRCALVVLP